MRRRTQQLENGFNTDKSVLRNSPNPATPAKARDLDCNFNGDRRGLHHTFTLSHPVKYFRPNSFITSPVNIRKSWAGSITPCATIHLYSSVFILTIYWPNTFMAQHRHECTHQHPTTCILQRQVTTCRGNDISDNLINCSLDTYTYCSAMPPYTHAYYRKQLRNRRTLDHDTLKWNVFNNKQYMVQSIHL